MSRDNIYDIKELGYIPPKYGGVSVSIARLIDKLTEDGLIVGGFYTGDNHDERVHQSNLFDPELNLSTKRFILEFPKCKQVLRPYRILHSHYSLEHMIYMWGFIHLLHKKLVITVHNSMVQRFYKQCDSINRFFLNKVANSPYVTWIAVSEQAKEEMLKLPVSFNNTIHVIPAYIPDNRKEDGVLPPPLQIYIQQHKRIIVFYGHSFMLHEGTDVYGFAEALKLYSGLMKGENDKIGFILCLTEDGDKDRIESLHQTAAQLGIDDKIFWQIGPIDNMKALWNKTDVYIRPTFTDGDSVAVREALDLGVQVVASDVCERPGRTIVYKYSSQEDFIDKVNTALQKGHTEAIPDYSNYNKLREVYSEILGK